MKTMLYKTLLPYFIVLEDLSLAAIQALHLGLLDPELETQHADPGFTGG